MADVEYEPATFHELGRLDRCRHFGPLQRAARCLRAEQSAVEKARAFIVGSAQANECHVVAGQVQRKGKQLRGAAQFLRYVIHFKQFRTTPVLSRVRVYTWRPVAKNLRKNDVPSN